MANCELWQRVEVVGPGRQLIRVKQVCGSADDAKPYWVAGSLGKVRVVMCKRHYKIASRRWKRKSVAPVVELPDVA